MKLEALFGNTDITNEQGSCGIRKPILKGGHNRHYAVSRVNIQEAKPHFHKKTWELYIVEKGSGTLLIDGVSHKINEGDVVEIPPNVIHQAIPDDELHVLVVMSPQNAEVNDIEYVE
jgi:quercetin dioxygenase-like cupin family protein